MTGKKRRGGRDTPDTRNTWAHAGTRITRTNLTTIHPNPTTHSHEKRDMTGSVAMVKLVERVGVVCDGSMTTCNQPPVAT